MKRDSHPKEMDGWKKKFCKLLRVAGKFLRDYRDSIKLIREFFGKLSTTWVFQKGEQRAGSAKINES